MFSTVATRLDGLRQRYAEPHRAYHTQAHVDAMLAGLATVRPVLDWPEPVELAVWYHDAIYDPAAADNEARSAALLRAELAGLLEPALLDRAALLILLTKDHALPDVGAAWAGDAALFLDLDMAVLGAEPASYDAYERGIAAEYVPVYGVTQYEAGRQRFLTEMLARPRLFLTDQSHRELDAQARRNIQRWLTPPRG